MGTYASFMLTLDELDELLFGVTAALDIALRGSKAGMPSQLLDIAHTSTHI